MAPGNGGKPRNGVAQWIALVLTSLGLIAAGIGAYYRVSSRAENNTEEIGELREKMHMLRSDLEKEIDERTEHEMNRLQKEIDELRHQP